MSTQRRSFFALKCDPPDLASCEAACALSLSGGDAFSLGATLFVPRQGNDQIVVEQPGAFRFGCDEGAVLFESKNLGRHRSDPADFHLFEGEWNRIDAVYDGSTLRLYIQGIAAYEARVTGERFVDASTRWQIGDMDGYLQEVTLAARALTDDEVRCNQFEHAVPDGEMELCADFDAFEPCDRGRHALPLQLAGHCDVANLVPALQAGTGGYALPQRSPANPGAFPSGAFTVLAKVFATVAPDTGDAYVFANGPLGDAQGFALGVAARQTKPFCVIAGTRYEFEGQISAAVWSDLAVSVSGTTATFFIDGASAGSVVLAAPLARTDPAAVTVGNILNASGAAAAGFPGYIDAVAVFDQALDAARLASYADVAPYRFDADLAALWLFSGEAPIEVLHDGPLLYAGGAAVALRENTVREPVPPTLSFAMPDVATGSTAAEAWESFAAATVLLDTVKALTGQDAVSGFSGGGRDKLNGSVEGLMSVTLAADARVRSLEDTGDVGRDVLVGLFATASGVAALWPAFEAFFLLGQRWHAAYRLQRFFRYLRIFSLSTRGKLLLLFAAAAAAVAVALALRPSPDPEEEKTKGATVSLKSLAFYNDASKERGAVCIRPAFGKEPVLPEWTAGCGTSQSAYWRVGADARPVLRATFSVTALEAPVSVQVEAAAQGDKLLGSLDAQTVALAAVGDVTVEFPLAHQALAAADLGSHEVRFQWRVGGKLLGSTKHEVHLLAARPLAPWSNAPGVGELPALPAIRLAEAVQAQESAEGEVNRRFCGQFVAWARSQAAAGALAGRAWADGSAFAKWDATHHALTFNIGAFFTVCAGTAAAGVGALDTACLLLALARMEGLASVRLAEASALAGTGSLTVRAAYRLGATQIERSLATGAYAVGCVNDGVHDRVYDAFLEPVDASDVRVPATGLPFSLGTEKTDAVAKLDASTYRTLLCAPGTTGCMALKTAVLAFGTLPLGGIQPGRPVLKRTTDRPPFDSYVIGSLPLDPHTVRCHSISFVDIEVMIVSAVNRFVAAPGDPDSLRAVLLDLWRAVSRNETNDGQGFPIPQTDYQEDSLYVLLHYLLDEEEEPTGKDEWAQYADAVERLLNSTVENLRYGMSDWNSSIGSSFDPQEWVHIIQLPDGSLMCDCEDSDEASWTSYATVGGQAISVPGFYLANDEDWQQLSRLKDRTPAVDAGGDVRCVQGIIVDSESESGLADARRRMLYSSDNTWRLGDYELVRLDVPEPVYYWNDLLATPAWVAM